ncbi:uncharacterized protein LOC143289940 [Babylonia areolata]|uniref:uncharacterized protein LOC143289940 n=1 Tax=Babylonia areolata TaxID=304850 RepID=UPI003FD164FD
MAISLSIVSAFVLVALVTFTPADSATCEILKNGALTMFSGDQHTVALPCRYQLADFTCGDYTIKVEAESSLDGTDQYSPESVSITLTQQTGNKPMDRLAQHWSSGTATSLGSSGQRHFP